MDIFVYGIFHSGIMINKILVSRECLYNLCLWDENNLLVSSQDKTIKLVDLRNNKVIKSMKGHNNYVITLHKIKYFQYGSFLLSHGFENDQIKNGELKINYILYLIYNFIMLNFLLYK